MKNNIKLNPKFDVDWASIKLYSECISDLITHESVKSIKNYIQHGHTNCLEHSLYVSYTSFVIAKRLGLDYKSAARGAMLHEFFLYDWHEKGNSEGLHGFSHARVALRNATKHFELNAIEQEIIAKHMWPLTLSPPGKKEAWVVTLADKYCTIMETIKLENKDRVRQLIALEVH